LNEITDSRGFVGASDDAYKLLFGTKTDQAKLLNLLDSKWVGGALNVADVAAGITEDWYNKTYTINGTENIDWAKLIGVNAMDTGIQAAIGATGIGGTILLINSGVQLGGTVGLSLQKSYDSLIASDSNRDLLNKSTENASQALKRADIGNVTKSAAELIYSVQFEGIGDGINMVSKVAQNPSLDTFNQALDEYQKKRWESVSSSFGNTLRSVGDFADGVVDLGVTASAAVNNTEIATVSSVVQHLPIDQSIKDNIDKSLTHTIERNQRTAESAMNLFNFGKDNQGKWFNWPSKEDMKWFSQ
jgi:hypothetical protein